VHKEICSSYSLNLSVILVQELTHLYYALQFAENCEGNKEMYNGPEWQPINIESGCSEKGILTNIVYVKYPGIRNKKKQKCSTGQPDVKSGMNWIWLLLLSVEESIWVKNISQK
jgi:hypothetical protein